jgi:CheY-like chemotaxis protein
VYAIVKQSNGHIRVESEPGQGATFFIYLPRLKQAVSTQPLPPSPGDMAAGTETVLLVEDDDDVRDLVGRILINQGYSLLVANNGQTALQLAADPAAHIDLLLTDVIMPGTNGKALAEALTQARPGLKVLFMTGYAEEIISQYGLLDQHMALLQKPFSPVSLVGKVRAILDG